MTDGTAAGTALVKDINPGSGSSRPYGFFALGNGKAVFSASDGTHGDELWVTDGTAAGTALLDDINPGSGNSFSPQGLRTSLGNSLGNSFPSQGLFTSLGNGKALFAANDSTHGYELWMTDGTAAGTTLVDDINPGSRHSYPFDITGLGNGQAVFSAYDGTHGFELWATDGTAAGTKLVDDINPGSGGSLNRGALSFPPSITSLGNGKALFAANDGTHGYELWVTDGTAAGTTLVDDINPGSGNSLPYDFTALGNGKAVFVANDGTHGNELWVTDGTAFGTALVKDIYPGSGSSFLHAFISQDGLPSFAALGNGKAVFQARDPTNGVELWVTDGTAAGTALVKNIYGGTAGSYPQQITALGNGKALFQGFNGISSHPGQGIELWVTDGTAAGTALVKDINPVVGSYPVPTSSYPQHITALGNGKALFSADDGTHGYELWVTDGTAAGTALVDDIRPGGFGSAPDNFTVLDTTAPVEPQSTLPVSIGGTATILHSFLYSYDDVSGPDQVTYTVLTAPIHGAILDNGVAATSFTQADIDNGLVQYRENGDVATRDGFTFTVSDQAGNETSTHDYTIAILNTMAPVIDANATLPAPIGGSAMIEKNILCTVALGDDPAEVKYSVTTAPAHGTLLVSGEAATGFTQADIDNHLVQYRENGDTATSDSFTFQATDAAGDQTPVTTFAIAITDGAQGRGSGGQSSASGSTTEAISATVPLFDLLEFSFGANLTLGYSANGDDTGGALTVGDGMHTANLALLGQYAAAGFATAPDPGGGTLVTYTAGQGGSADPNLLAMPQH